MAENVKEQMLRYLTDAYAAETGGLGSLKDLEASATDADLKRVVADHIAVTQSQADRVEARILALGGQKSAPKSLVDQVIGKASHLVNVLHSQEDKQTQDTIKAYSLEHFEVGAYLSMEAFANAIGDSETAQLAKTIIGEEQMAAERMQRLIPQLAVKSLANATGTAATV